MKLTGQQSELLDVQAALAKLEGMPRRAVVVGGMDMLPETYTPGAPGWTDQVSKVEPDGASYAIDVPDVHLGKSVDVSGKTVRIPLADAKAQVAVEAKK